MPELEIDERIRLLIDSRATAFSTTRGSFLNRLFTAWISALRAVCAAVERTAVHWQASLGAPRECAAAMREASPLRQELADHLRDAYDYQIELGRAPEAAWQYVLDHFGDYEAILGELETLHQPPPLWETLTRFLALPLALVLMSSFRGGYIGLYYKDFILPVVWIALLGAAPLAACDPRALRLPYWTRWLTRLLALFLFWFSLYEEGMPSADILLAATILMIPALQLRPFRSPRYVTRMRAWMAAAMFGHLLVVMKFLLANYLLSNPALEPAKLGIGVAITFIVVFWGVLFARPGWPVLALATAYCHGLVLTVCLALWPPHHLPLLESIRPGFWMNPARCTMLAALAGWTFFSHRTYRHWLPAIGVVAMVMTYITRLKNLDGPQFSYYELILSAALPQLLFLAPVGELIRERLRRGK